MGQKIREKNDQRFNSGKIKLTNKKPNEYPWGSDQTRLFEKENKEKDIFYEHIKENKKKYRNKVREDGPKRVGLNEFIGNK
jgi:hypothetical protein